MNVLEVSSLALAYLGDSIYESYIREYLIKKGISHVNDLQVESLNYVSAKSQARILKDLMDKNIFTEEELSVIKRARNTKSKSHPKSCDIITYQHATSLEALFGYLKLRKNEERIEEIISKILY
ncbi:MAG: Mini-ribonuclease 3 [Bacilli bacterium]